MKFNIYSRFDLEVTREQGQWVAYRLGQGTKRKESGLHIPAEINAADILVYLDDVYHEYATPTTSVQMYAV